MHSPRLTLLLLLLAVTARASLNEVHEACRRLCEGESVCLRKCVAHAELFELRADFIQAAATFHPSVETRMKVLRTGANLDTLSLCKGAGWSLDNTLTCLRSYPTPEVIRACKRLSSLQDEQVRCVRMGKPLADIEACTLFAPGSDARLACLEKEVTAQETRDCRQKGGDTPARLACLEDVERNRVAESNRFLAETRRRIDGEAQRSLATKRK